MRAGLMAKAVVLAAPPTTGSLRLLPDPGGVCGEEGRATTGHGGR